MSGGRPSSNQWTCSERVTWRHRGRVITWRTSSPANWRGRCKRSCHLAFNIRPSLANRRHGEGGQKGEQMFPLLLLFPGIFFLLLQHSLHSNRSSCSHSQTQPLLTWINLGLCKQLHYFVLYSRINMSWTSRNLHQKPTWKFYCIELFVYILGKFGFECLHLWPTC